MENIRSIQLKRLHGRLGEVMYQLTRVQFSVFGPLDVWQPSINAYRCSDCMAICVDLAGVDKDRIDLQVEPKRLLLRGQRHPPEPAAVGNKPIQVLAMEIDYGPFQREVEFPAEVDPDRVTAEQQKGLLWIYLPFLTHG